MSTTNCMWLLRTDDVARRGLLRGKNLIRLRNGMTRGETGLMSVIYGGFVFGRTTALSSQKFSLLEHQGVQFILHFTCIFKMYFWSCFTTLTVACKVPARPGQPGKSMTGKGIVNV